MAYQPSKYSNSHSFPVRDDVIGVVMYDKRGGDITRFAVQLQRLVDVFEETWKTFAQIDHEPANPKGHDLYSEGLHVDIYHTDGQQSTIDCYGSGSSLPNPPVVLMYTCKTYLTDNIDYFIQAASNQIPLNSPPSFP